MLAIVKNNEKDDNEWRNSNLHRRYRNDILRTSISIVYAFPVLNVFRIGTEKKDIGFCAILT